MKTKYDHLSKEDLINQLVKRDSERKLGLVWERDRIEHERALNDDFVALDFIPEHSVGNAPFQNFLIEGDNFDALRYLSIAYKGRVKCDAFANSLCHARMPLWASMISMS